MRTMEADICSWSAVSSRSSCSSVIFPCGIAFEDRLTEPGLAGAFATFRGAERFEALFVEAFSDADAFGAARFPDVFAGLLAEERFAGARFDAGFLAAFDGAFRVDRFGVFFAGARFVAGAFFEEGERVFGERFAVLRVGCFFAGMIVTYLRRSEKSMSSSSSMFLPISSTCSPIASI